MMKRIRKNQDGYVLAYVLVVVLVVSLIAVIACTTAMNNMKAQMAAVNYTQAKYEAEGVVERFTAELQGAVTNAAKNMQQIPPVSNTGGENLLALSNEEAAIDAIVNSLKTQLNLIVEDIKYDFSEENITPKSYVGVYQNNEGENDRGFFPVDILLEVENNHVKVEAGYRILFLADVKGDNAYAITGAAIEYISYNVSVAEKGEGG